MKFTVERNLLKDAISAVAGIAKGRNAANIPILSHVLVEASGSSIRLTGHDLDSCLSLEVPADVEIEGEGALPSDRFSKLVSGLSEGAQLTVDTTVDGQQAHIKAARSSYRFGILPATDFPQPLEPTESISFTLSAAEVLRLFKKPSGCISSEASRHHLCGIFLHKTNKQLAACATDGHTLLRTISKASVPDFDGVIVPDKSCDDIARLASSGEVQFEVGRTLIAAQCGTRRFVSKLVDGTFPDYTRVIPNPTAPFITVATADIEGAVARLLTAGDPKNSRAIKLAWNDDVDTLAMSSVSDTGEGSEQIDCDCPGREASHTGANAEYLQRIATAFDSKRIRFLIDGPGDPIRLEDPDDPDVVAVIMPMRV